MILNQQLVILNERVVLEETKAEKDLGVIISSDGKNNTNACYYVLIKYIKIIIIFFTNRKTPRLIFKHNMFLTQQGSNNT